MPHCPAPPRNTPCAPAGATRPPSHRARPAPPTVDRMATASIPGVELVATGTWAASTGSTRVHRADLESMLAAAQDPTVDAGPIKLGHIDPRYDGEPSMGWVRPRKIVDRPDGTSVLVGDLVGMPSKLAEVAPTAYRRRSVEIGWGLKAPSGKSYKAAIVGIALLGVTAPAVKGLADVLSLYAGPAHVELTTELPAVDGLDSAAAAQLISALAAGAPADAVEAVAHALGARDTANVPAPVADPPEPASSNRAPSAPTREDAPRMALTEQRIRELLSLEADADVEAAIADLARVRSTAEPEPDPAKGGEPAAPNAVPGQPAETPATDVPPVAAPVVPDPVAAPGARMPELATLSAGTFAELTALAEEARTNRRERTLDDAVRSGRIAPAERSLFAAQLARDEHGTTALLSHLTPRFAVTALGSAAAPEAEPDAGAWDEFERAIGAAPQA